MRVKMKGLIGGQPLVLYRLILVQVDFLLILAETSSPVLLKVKIELRVVNWKHSNRSPDPTDSIHFIDIRCDSTGFRKLYKVILILMLVVFKRANVSRDSSSSGQH